MFQVYYEERFPHQTASSISWIGSLQVALLMGLGIIIGPIFDAGYLRTLTCVGTFISILALMLTSICTQYWQILLTQGLLLGIGNGCLFIPSTAILPSYFLKKRSLAIGLAATGSAVGMFGYLKVTLKLKFNANPDQEELSFQSFSINYNQKSDLAGRCE